MTAPVTHGADLAALREWSAAAAAGADQLSEVAVRLDRSIMALAWHGPDHRRIDDAPRYFL